MMYYKVVKDNFLFETGAILKQEGKGYTPINRAFYTNAVPDNCNEYVSSEIIENSPEYFKKVYPVDLLTKTVYKVKEEALEILKKSHK